MACHAEPPFTPEQVAWINQRLADRAIPVIQDQLRHCPRCWVLPLNRVAACVDVDCPTRQPGSAAPADHRGLAA